MSGIPGGAWTDRPRCSATIPPASMLLRHADSPDDPRCLRYAVRRGLCRQHNWVVYGDHDRIVRRILEIPPRP